MPTPTSSEHDSRHSSRDSSPQPPNDSGAAVQDAVLESADNPQDTDFAGVGDQPPGVGEQLFKSAQTSPSSSAPPSPRSRSGTEDNADPSSITSAPAKPTSGEKGFFKSSSDLAVRCITAILHLIKSLFEMIDTGIDRAANLVGVKNCKPFAYTGDAVKSGALSAMNSTKAVFSRGKSSSVSRPTAVPAPSGE